MRFWFEHSSDVPLREQIVTQVSLGILTGELAPDERLPSIRDLARRFDLHANTVSAGYRQLEAEGWVVSRKGSGVYVRTTEARAAKGSAVGPTPPLAIDRLVANLFESARRLKIPAETLIARVQAWQPPAAFDRILLVEPDPALRAIIQAELAEFTSLPLTACDFAQAESEATPTALVLTLPSKLERLTTQLAPAARKPHALRVRSVPDSLLRHLPPPEARHNYLVGIASAWPDFLRFARTMLVAAGFSADALIVRETTAAGWRAALKPAAAIVCDVVTARGLPAAQTIVMRILADDASAAVQQLLGNPASAPAHSVSS